MVNKEFTHKLADVIEAQEETSISAKSGFNMGDFMHHCGTPACVAGWAIAIGENVNDIDEAMKTHGYRYSYTRLAAKHMGLDQDTAEDLFIGYKYTDKERIVKTLRHLADTDDLVWFTEENEHE